jgi:hypothetical protein
MYLLRGFIIRVIEVVSYLGIAVFTAAGVLYGGYAPVLGYGGPSWGGGILAVVGGIAGFVAGALTFGLLLVLIDIRENTRR